jgi:hypothetical protein
MTISEQCDEYLEARYRSAVTAVKDGLRTFTPYQIAKLVRDTGRNMNQFAADVAEARIGRPPVSRPHRVSARSYLKPQAEQSAGLHSAWRPRQESSAWGRSVLIKEGRY